MTDPKPPDSVPPPVQPDSDHESDHEGEYPSADDPHRGRHEEDGYYDDDGQWHDHPDETSTPAPPDAPTPTSSTPPPPPDSEPAAEPDLFENVVTQALAAYKEELERCQQERLRVWTEDNDSRFGTGVGTGERPWAGYDRNRPAPALPDCSAIEKNIATLEELLARLRGRGDEKGPRGESEDESHSETPMAESAPAQNDRRSDLEDLARRFEARDENVKRLIREMKPPPALPPRSPGGIPKYLLDLYRFFKPFVEASNRAEEYNSPQVPNDDPKSVPDDQK